jgi:hypothetical protein
MKLCLVGILPRLEIMSNPKILKDYVAEVRVANRRYDKAAYEFALRELGAFVMSMIVLEKPGKHEAPDRLLK